MITIANIFYRLHPSPNLKEMQSIYLYPSTCFFEGTVLSEGRGTDKPFQIFGHPSLPKTLIRFYAKTKCRRQKQQMLLPAMLWMEFKRHN